MTETPLSLNLTIYMLTTMGLTGAGLLFTLISLAGTIRDRCHKRLFFTLFTAFLTFYSLSLWLPATGLIEGFTGSYTLTNVLFYMTVFFYLLYFHLALGGRHARTVVALTALFIWLLGLSLAANLTGDGISLTRWIKMPNWGSVTIAAAFLFLLVRLIMAYCYHETGAAGASVSLLIFLLPMVINIITSGSIRGLHAKTFTVYALPLLTVWEFARLFTSPVSHRQPGTSHGFLREKLSETKEENHSLSQSLENREEELGSYLIKARKISRALLPKTIHHDGNWEVATYFSPRQRAEKKAFFDFYYTYGRKVAGVSFFETPAALDGALYTSLLKKEWTEDFNEAPVLASLYRRINAHLKDIFSSGDLVGSVMKFAEDKVEYTGYNNPPLFYTNGRLSKCAPLIQDKARTAQEIKSYNIPCGQGDSFLICNDVFLEKPAPVTGKTFARDRLPQVLETFKGNAADMVKELMDERNKLMGKRDDEGILVIYVRRT